MSTATGELPLIPSASLYDYSKLIFAYLAMLGLTEQVIPHMGVWCPWATTANYVMWMAPVIYWSFQAWPFPSTKDSPGSPPGHENVIHYLVMTALDPLVAKILSYNTIDLDFNAGLPTAENILTNQSDTLEYPPPPILNSLKTFPFPSRNLFLDKIFSIK
ncbi:hypothetical protein DSO57_1028654 [Entomophthora muscae]|uniref:Uncharacterized protein n=1 Tax=Entomophthora muscae TaxID=34485 RepID=A0ACC2RG44_9FUNG|nr:hypothetical protein DSO57_1028654 [Entomophthora muscae]